MVLFVGNSLAAGLGVPEDSAFPALIQQKIDSVHLGFRVVNAGVSGATSADGLQQVPWLLRQPVSVLVLELGGNDALRGLPVPALQQNLRGIIDKFRQKYPALPVVIAGMEAPPNLGAQYTADFRAVYPRLAQEEHAALVPFLLEDVGGRPELNQADHIHPNSAGHRIVAQNVWRVLEPVLRRLPATAQAGRPNSAPPGKAAAAPRR
ncbi:MAG TPA: arylesterase [Longimicrobiales bacterium]